MMQVRTTPTGKQKLFVEEYLVDLNATQAAIRAGYSVKTAYAIGFENLRKPGIQQSIQIALAERSQRTEIDQDWVLQTLKENIERAMQEHPVVDRRGNPTGEYAYDGAVANKGLELIGQHFKMFVERKEIDVRQQVVYWTIGRGYTDGPSPSVNGTVVDVEE